MNDRVTKCLGLISQYNPLRLVPGALLRADNVMIRREDVIEDRRGHKVYSALPAAAKQILSYSNKVLVHYGDKIAFDNNGVFTNYAGSYSEPENARIRFVEAFSNLYFTTSRGVQAISDVAGSAGRLAGSPRALDPTFSLTGTAGFLANGSQCAYRVTLRRQDVQGNIITGYPSQRAWVANTTGGSRDLKLTVYLPSDAAATDVIQVYRTEQATGSTSDVSGDEMGLVFQYEILDADITLGHFTFTDSVDDGLRGATLYTSPSQEGIAQANERPPLAKDICLYKSTYMLYANTSTKQRLNITLVGTAQLSGKQIVLGGQTYNFGATEIATGVGAPQAQVFASGIAASDINNTALSLVRVINRNALNTGYYAYYLTGPSDLPGKILIEERGVGSVPFSITAQDAAVGSMFFPAPPLNGATSKKSTSTNSVQKNAIYYAKSQQPEAVPALNYVLVGPSNKEILRVVALRDSAIIIKEEGVYRLTGETPQSFTIVPVDLTVLCKSADSIAVLANQVIMLSNQGVVRISEDGVEVISRDIEPNIVPLLTNSDLANLTCAVGYESERSYFLSTITDKSDTEQNQTLVYNVFTKTWVRHTYGFTTAVIEPLGDKMYFAKPQDGSLYVERKSFTDEDFADPDSPIVITEVQGDVVSFTITGGTPDVGWSIEQGTTYIGIASLKVVAGGYTARLREKPPQSFGPGPATIYPDVGMNFEWHSWTAQAPDQMKQVSQVGILADDMPGSNSVTFLEVSFKSNFDNEAELVAVQQPGQGWGAAWGDSPWGGTGDSAGYPTYVPRNKQYCTRLSIGVRHKNARERLSVAGFCLSFSVVGERIGR